MEHALLTAEEAALVKLWLQRPQGRRRLADVAELEEWVLDHEPALLPKKDDAYEYLARLLREHIEHG
jgi:hypothetical protein